MELVDHVQRAVELRKTLISRRGILVVEYPDMSQAVDASFYHELMPNIRTGELVLRSKINAKIIDPIAMKGKKDYFDVALHTPKEIEDCVKRDDADFSLWFKGKKGFTREAIRDYNSPVIFQVAGCPFNKIVKEEEDKKKGNTSGCWYCFVDPESNDGIPGKGKTYLSIDDAVDSMIFATETLSKRYEAHGAKVRPKVLRISGGEPTLIPKEILMFLKKLYDKRSDVFVQLDTNLATGHYLDLLEKGNPELRNIWHEIAQYPVVFLTAFKGTDEENLRRNVRSSMTMEDMEYSFMRLLNSGFDVFPQFYNPNPLTIAPFVKQMSKKVKNFEYRAHVGRILTRFNPTEKRNEDLLVEEAEELGINPEEFIEKNKNRRPEEAESNLKLSEEALDELLREMHGHNIGYKDTVRSDVRLYPV